MFVTRNSENAAALQNSPEAFVENAILAIADVDQDVEAERALADAATLARITAQERLIRQQESQIVQLNTSLRVSEASKTELTRLMTMTRGF